MKAKDMIPNEFYSMPGEDGFIFKYKSTTGHYICGSEGDLDSQSAFAIDGEIEVTPYEERVNNERRTR